MDRMGLHQTFRFKYESRESVRSFLGGLAASASVDERAPDFYVLSQVSDEPKFTFDCEITPTGIRSERAGEYFAFLGVFVEALTGRFGAVTVEDE
jgi:hypothetical protein